jgi:hypothetical protein
MLALVPLRLSDFPRDGARSDLGSPVVPIFPSLRISRFRCCWLSDPWLVSSFADVRDLRAPSVGIGSLGLALELTCGPSSTAQSPLVFAALSASLLPPLRLVTEPPQK